MSETRSGYIEIGRPVPLSTLEELFHSKKRLTALLDEVAAGSELPITRRRKPVARLVPVQPGLDRTKARRAADGERRDR
jgi:antitoxin (DNA-binding transcriptional repressor) of toxin-antitoxin stability system